MSRTIYAQTGFEGAREIKLILQEKVLQKLAIKFDTMRRVNVAL